jgi:actin-like ATPase involved in cell morphogenesis
MSRFIRTGQATFDAAGTAQVTIGVPNGVTWRVEVTTVTTTSTTRTTASVYLGSPSPAAMVDSTYSGNRDTSDTVHEVIGGELVTCQWTGGDVGKVATLRISGDQRQG